MTARQHHRQASETRRNLLGHGRSTGLAIHRPAIPWLESSWTICRCHEERLWLLAARFQHRQEAGERLTQAAI